MSDAVVQVTASQETRAHAAVTAAVQSGELVPQPCEVGTGCKGTVQAHHDDYAKPLDVRWLCRRHHQLVHRRPGAVKPVMIRADITSDEWAQMRVIAARERRPVQDLVADALRAAYPLTEGTK